MKKIYLSILLLFLTNNMFSQVTIGSALPSNMDALLDLKNNNDNSSSKGLLLPRVALTSLTSSTPLSNHVNGMLVYNTANVDTEILPGCYYNNGIKWIHISSDGGTLEASNGLTKTDDYIKLGGNLSLPTAITGISASNKLTFQGSGKDAVNVLDIMTFDGTTKKIGIGNLEAMKISGIISPSETLDIEGTARISKSKGTSAYTVTGRDRTGAITEVKLGNGLYIQNGTLSFGAPNTEVKGSDVVNTITNVGGGSSYSPSSSDTTIWVSALPTPNSIGAHIMLPTNVKKGRTITIIAAASKIKIGVKSKQNGDDGYITTSNSVNYAPDEAIGLFEIPHQKRVTFQYIDGAWSTRGTWVVIMKDF